MKILSEWDALETDLHKIFGIDLEDGILGRRSWRWFTIRVVRAISEGEQLAQRLGLTAINGGGE